MSKKYIGITIGPILDTMSDASTPAGMWFSSFLFSDITRRLCEKITEASDIFENVSFFSPYYPTNEEENVNGELRKKLDIFEDGVGKYHDRILFSAETKSLDVCEEGLRGIIDSVKSETLMYFEALFEKGLCERKTAESFFKDYFQIHYIIEDMLQATNIILDMSDKLSALELIKSFPWDNSANPITAVLLGKEDRKNNLIKESGLFKAVRDKKALISTSGGTTHIRTIEEIASNEKMVGWKVGKYFAIINADGDRMGKTLEKLDNDDLVLFSKSMLNHASKATEEISRFGGMTIYAGGDDLLFLAPLVGSDGTSVFSLCDTIRKLFQGSFENEFSGKLQDLPTLSFGISAQYYKYPLYEALEESRKLLQEAKSQPRKNATVFQLQKHSGQTLRLTIPNDNLNLIVRLLSIGTQTKDTNVTILHSLIYSLEQFRTMYCKLIKETREDDMFENKKDRFVKIWSQMFDNSDQKIYLDYIKEIAGFFYDGSMGMERLIAQIPNLDKEVQMKERTVEEELVSSFSAMLRLKKFYQEKEGDSE